ncbi:hypothetical protein NLU13_5991 [Sarocladium strictum]|uniref:Uncharacterized protein n=1 Tax=Sarocladium strictum TaxID=5046 RepID=A0AA39GGM3_SARSR|nr:hypothetical protein NLU13_5991 [Sarocladium strictum]
MATVIQQQFPPDHHHLINNPAVTASHSSSPHHRHNHRHDHHDDNKSSTSPRHANDAFSSSSHETSATPTLPRFDGNTSTVAEIDSQARLAAGHLGDHQSHPHDSRLTSAAGTAAAPNISSSATVDRGSRIPSPPSSSPAASVGPKSMTDDATTVHMASHVSSIANPSLGHHSTSSTDPTPSFPQSQPVAAQSQQAQAQTQAHQQQQPSPPNDDFQIPNDASRLAPGVAADPAQTVIHIRDLAHIQSLAKADLMGAQSTAAGGGILNDPPLQQMKYEISGMPIGDVIEMVAALLTKITTTNDLQHDAMQRNAVHQQQAGQSSDSGGSSQMSPLSHSVLAFHGKNVPGITILSYLSRIHKYCPTTYEVFLSLLVYFDRMTERVNDMVTRSEESRRRAAAQSGSSSRPESHQQDQTMADKDSSLADSDESDSDLADDDDDDDDDEMADSSGAPSRSGSAKATALPAEQPIGAGPATYFVVDSFNIHRLIIAGVTCASKFFSDVFYTNSRYAKVGGLPLVELNHLELQFLLLNDFRLAVPVEDLEAYATMLVEFYAREVVASKAGARAA